jgi:acetyl esterase/lipase
LNDAPTPPGAVDVRDLLDPELAPLLAGLELAPLDTEGLARLGGSFEMPRLPDAVVWTEHLVPGDPAVPVRVHRTAGAKGPQPAIVTIHGGGYVLGSYDLDDALLDAWCPALGVVGVSVQHRLAPDHPYPGPLEDCCAALR